MAREDRRFKREHKTKLFSLISARGRAGVQLFERVFVARRLRGERLAKKSWRRRRRRSLLRLFAFARAAACRQLAVLALMDARARVDAKQQRKKKKFFSVFPL